MVTAYVLIETAVGTGGAVAKSLKALKEVKSADRVTGPYDVITNVETEDLHALDGFLQQRVHPLQGVKKTITCVVVQR